MENRKIKLIINGCLRPAEIQLAGKVKDRVNIEKAEDILEALDRLLKKRRFKIEEIDEITAPTFCGRGSYTGHRVGIAIVNALNLALGRKKVLKPEYGQKPKISGNKKRRQPRVV